MIKKHIIYPLVAIAVLTLSSWIYVAQIDRTIEVAKIHNEKRLTIAIDPGHGGMDGGATGKNGTAEKDINLAIALKLKKVLADEGYQVVMTRERDQTLSTQGDESTSFNKAADMRERKRIIDESDAALAISIHLNSFPQDESVYGAQCFYPATGSNSQLEQISKYVAEAIQQELENNIQDGRQRNVMPKSDLYLFKKCIKPTVLVECGFVSNPEEEKALKSPKIQQIIAKSIYEGIRKSEVNLQEK